jgi:signal transduction histidine kinase
LEKNLRSHARLLENISHEFKNPLSVVYGYATHLLKQEAAGCPPDELSRGLRSIHSSAERLNTLLEDLLDSVRLGNRKLSLDRSPVSAWALASEAVADHIPQARQRQHSLEMAGADPGLMVCADVQRVQQVLANLVGNALKFTPAGGAVRVSVDACDAGARFCVRDSGVGIHPEDMPHLFERFYRGVREPSQVPGLGLGLDISRALVELHGGRIWAESTLGQGAAFYVTLPMAVPGVTPGN